MSSQEEAVEEAEEAVVEEAEEGTQTQTNL
jgi:hypothetical protein